MLRHVLKGEPRIALEDRLGYRLTDSFETFPFPSDWGGRADLDAAGETYYLFRANLMAEPVTRAEYMEGADLRASHPPTIASMILVSAFPA